MAVLYLAEFVEIYPYQGGGVQAPWTPPVAEQTVAIGVGSVQGAVWNAKTKFVRVSTDAICSVAFGTNPTAAATNARLPANSTEYFRVNQGERIAVIQNT